jgi:hypothetical protein
VTAIIKACNGPRTVAPEYAGDTRVSRAGGLPPGSALAADAPENLVDNTGMCDYKNLFSDMDAGNGLNSPEDTFAKHSVCLPTWPSEVLIHLSFVLEPSLGILLPNIMYRKAVYGSTIDFSERPQDPGRRTEVFGYGSRGFESSRQRAHVNSIERTFGDQSATKQVDLPSACRRQGSIIAAAQKSVSISATVNRRVTDEPESGM